MRLLVIGLTLVFGLISSAPNFQGAQFLKWPELFKHYSEHQSGEESFSSMLSFLKEHYFNNEHQGKNEQHMPFKTMRFGCTFVIVMEYLVEPPRPNGVHHIENHISHFGEHNRSLNDFSGTVWNPPRTV